MIIIFFSPTNHFNSISFPRNHNEPLLLHVDDVFDQLMLLGGKATHAQIDIPLILRAYLSFVIFIADVFIS